jgi:hypothetical protein
MVTPRDSPHHTDQDEVGQLGLADLEAAPVGAIEAWEPPLSPTASLAMEKLGASDQKTLLTKRERAALNSQRTLLEFQLASDAIGLTPRAAAQKLLEAMQAVNRNGEANWWPRIMGLKMWIEMQTRLAATPTAPEVMAPATLPDLTPEQLREMSSDDLIEMMMVRRAPARAPDDRS